MLLKLALVLLGAWFIGVIGVYELGRLVHILLLVGLMLLLLGLLKARETAITRFNTEDHPARQKTGRRQGA